MQIRTIDAELIRKCFLGGANALDAKKDIVSHSINLRSCPRIHYIFLINDFLYRENGPHKLKILIC